MEKAREKKRFFAGSFIEGSSGRLAQIISEITNPLFIALPIFLTVALSTTTNPLQALLWWSITVVGTSVLPFLFILRGVRHGDYTDHHVSVREQRLVPLLFGLGCVFIVFTALLLIHASLPLIATVTAVIIVGIFATVITKFWKISFHLMGRAGAVTVVWLLFGPLAALLAPLVVLVGWARWQVRAHTPLQALAGSVLAVSVTLITFWLFGLLQ